MFVNDGGFVLFDFALRTILRTGTVHRWGDVLGPSRRQGCVPEVLDELLDRMLRDVTECRDAPRYLRSAAVREAEEGIDILRVVDVRRVVPRHVCVAGEDDAPDDLPLFSIVLFRVRAAVQKVFLLFRNPFRVLALLHGDEPAALHPVVPPVLFQLRLHREITSTPITNERHVLSIKVLLDVRYSFESVATCPVAVSKGVFLEERASK